MRSGTVVIAILLLSSLACSQTIATAAPTTPTPTLTETVVSTMTTVSTTVTTPAWTATVSQVQVNVRDEPGGDVEIGYVESGDVLTILRCLEKWCKVSEPQGAEWKQPYGWIYRGCLSDNPDELGCMAAK